MKRFLSSSDDPKGASKLVHIVYGVILIFIILAWIDSNFTYRLARIRFPGGHPSDYQVEAVGGKISLIRDVTRNYGSGKPGITFRSGEMWKDETWFPKPRWDFHHQKGFHFKGFIYLPYWMMAVVASSCWVGAFLFRKTPRIDPTAS